MWMILQNAKHILLTEFYCSSTRRTEEESIKEGVVTSTGCCYYGCRNTWRLCFPCYIDYDIPDYDEDELDNMSEIDINDFLGETTEITIVSSGTIREIAMEEKAYLEVFNL